MAVAFDQHSLNNTDHWESLNGVFDSFYQVDALQSAAARETFGANQHITSGTNPNADDSSSATPSNPEGQPKSSVAGFGVTNRSLGVTDVNITRHPSRTGDNPVVSTVSEKVGDVLKKPKYNNVCTAEIRLDYGKGWDPALKTSNIQLRTPVRLEKNILYSWEVSEWTTRSEGLMEYQPAVSFYMPTYTSTSVTIASEANLKKGFGDEDAVTDLKAGASGAARDGYRVLLPRMFLAPKTYFDLCNQVLTHITWVNASLKGHNLAPVQFNYNERDGTLALIVNTLVTGYRLDDLGVSNRDRNFWATCGIPSAKQVGYAAASFGPLMELTGGKNVKFRADQIYFHGQINYVSKPILWDGFREMLSLKTNAPGFVHVTQTRETSGSQTFNYDSGEGLAEVNPHPTILGQTATWYRPGQKRYFEIIGDVITGTNSQLPYVDVSVFTVRHHFFQVGNFALAPTPISTCKIRINREESLGSGNTFSSGSDPSNIRKPPSQVIQNYRRVPVSSSVNVGVNQSGRTYYTDTTQGIGGTGE